MNVLQSKSFRNGSVYALQTADGMPVETTDTFLPYYTKDAVGRKQNGLVDEDVGSRAERWMVGVSVMSGCPVGCLFCATGQLKKWRRLTAKEIVAQVEFILGQNQQDPRRAQEFKINYTRMGEPFLNIDAVREAIEIIDSWVPNTHHYISTIGVQGSDFSWIKDNVTLQLSLHSLDEARRRHLIPFPKLMTIPELGQVRTASKLKTTLNMTLVDAKDFDIEVLKQHFDPAHFFIKLSPINECVTSQANGLGSGIIEGINVV